MDFFFCFLLLLHKVLGCVLIASMRPCYACSTLQFEVVDVNALCSAAAAIFFRPNFLRAVVWFCGLDVFSVFSVCTKHTHTEACFTKEKKCSFSV